MLISDYISTLTIKKYPGLNTYFLVKITGGHGKVKTLFLHAGYNSLNNCAILFKDYAPRQQ